jgi:1-phosphofructokinase
MVYTVTFSPALDYTIRLETFAAGMIQKSSGESYYAGGKGINVSNVLTQLGIPNTALGFVAGFTGDEIEKLARALGITTDFIHMPSGNSRINVKIRPANGEETDINTGGCDIDNASLNEFYGKIEQIGTDDYLVLSGSIPRSLPQDIYETVLSKLSSKKVNCCVDATGGLLRNTLKYGPFLIKPNEEELGELFGETIRSEDDILRLAKLLRQEGARNILVSMGAKGAMLLTESEEKIKAPIVRGALVNTVGAGDSMLAGFLAGWLKYGDYKQALALGSASGAATAFCENIATGDEIQRLYESR